MMKKLAFLLVLALCLVPLALAEEAADAGEADGNLILVDIYMANQPGILQYNHKSVLVAVDETRCVYGDDDYVIDVNPLDYDGIAVRTDTYHYAISTDGSYDRVILAGNALDVWQIVSPSMLYDEVLSIEEADDAITVVSTMGEYDAGNVMPDAEEGTEPRWRYVVSADTLELQSLSALAELPDGTEQTLYTSTVTFDADMIEKDAVEALEAHLEAAEATRKTTMILDEGTPLERTYTFETPVGDGCMTWGWDNGIHYEIDMDRSTPSNEARDNDAVYYMKRTE